MIFFFVFLVGSCLASFVMVLTKNHDPSWRRRSQCDGCGHTLSGYQLIPVLSSLIFQKRCPLCRHQPAWIYGLVELGIGLMMVVNAWACPFGIKQVILHGLVLVGLHTSVMDWQSHHIPVFNLGVLAVLTVCWFVYQAVFLETGLIVAAILLGLALGWRLGKGQRLPLGIGDWFLLILSALWLQGTQLPLFLILTGLLGIATAAGYQRLYQTPLFPFAPAIFMAFWLTLILSF